MLFDAIWCDSIYHLNTTLMFVPITSEVTIGTGTVLKEIATGHLYKVGPRLNNREEIWGDDPWEIIDLEPGDGERTALAVNYDDLARKYFAEVNDKDRWRNDDL